MGVILSIRTNLPPVKKRGKYDHLPTEQQIMEQIINKHKKKKAK